MWRCIRMCFGISTSLCSEVDTCHTLYVLFVEEGDLRVLYCNVCVTKVLVRSTSIHDRDWVVLICVLVAGV